MNRQINRFKSFMVNGKYKEPIFKRIALVVFAFTAMIAASSIMAGNMMGEALSDQAKAIIAQAILNLEMQTGGSPVLPRHLKGEVTALRFSLEATGSYGFLMDEQLRILAHPDRAIEGTDMHDAPISDLGFKDILNKLENELEESGSLIEYNMQDYKGNAMVAFSAKLTNGWILTLVVPHFEYFKSTIWLEIILALLAITFAAIIISMLLRLNKRTLERDIQLGKLAAVTQNYKGVVWSVDSRNVLTTLRGRHLVDLGLLDPSHFEGKPVESIQPFFKVDFADYTQKARTDGPQDWIFETDGITYHSYMTCTRDDMGREVGVVGSIDDVTEQVCLRQRLEEALEEAEIANKAKSSFLANMSHEIRTPMNAILGITEILVQDKALPADVVEGLAKINSSGGLLLNIINDVLDFSKIEAGRLDIRPAPYEIASLVNDSVHLNMMRIGSKPIEFALEIDEDIPAKLIGDELRIKQILNNLLSNAFKYTESGAVTLCVGFEAAGENDVLITLGVRDTGHGMSKEQLDKLFDEYSRFQSDTTRTIEGTGLGMAITRRLVFLMNGTITVESEPEKGSLFVVTLPQQVVGSAKLGAELAANLRGFKMRLTASRERIQLARDPMPYGKVLVVDDVETNIYVAQGLLKLYDLQIDTATSGHEALEKILAGKVYDIVFMDHMMPGMDGIETTKRMREAGYDAPIVALTANAVAKQCEVFLQNGFDDFIAKPIDIRQLNAVLNRLIRDKQPLEIVEEARRKKNASPPAKADEPQAELDTMLYASFVRDARKAVTVLEEWLNSHSEETGSFTVTVHGMKSALANIGESTLSETAKALEQAGKTNDLAFMRQEAPGFLARLQGLIEQAASKQVEGGAAAESDAAYLAKRLGEIQSLCEDYDRKAVTDIIAELGRKGGDPSTREALDRMMEAVLHSEFEEAAELAASLAASLSTPKAVSGIEGLDIGRGLDKFDGDKETYYRIMRAFVSSLNCLLERSDLEGGASISDYEIAVHGVKGASLSVFADALGQAAGALENAARAKDMQYIQLHDKDFRVAAQKLANQVRAMLDAAESHLVKPKKDTPDPEALARLLAACEVYDMDSADAAIAEISAYEYETDSGLCQWLRERADMTDFAAIAQRLGGSH